MTTIVSAFIDLYRYDRHYKNKTLLEYLNYGKMVISLPIPKIIFVESHIIQLLPVQDKWTHYEIIQLHDLWLMDQFPKLDANKCIRKGSIHKDTTLYLILMLNKTNWMMEAIKKNEFNTDQFMWLDFGIFHVSNDYDEDIMKENILKSCQQSISSSQIFIATCKTYIKPPDNMPFHFYLKEPYWFFCGGIFLGHKNVLRQFSDLVQNETLDLIQNYGCITWEINIWFLIYSKYPHLFKTFLSNHNYKMTKLYN